jgi:hypothetical protein
MTAAVCGCRPRDDGAIAVCDYHEPHAHNLVYAIRDALDAELGDVVRELAGRSPTRLERKHAATGDFAIARPGAAAP